MDLKETIENALYSMGKFTTDECSEMAENLQFAIGQEFGQVDTLVTGTPISDKNNLSLKSDGDEDFERWIYEISLLLDKIIPVHGYTNAQRIEMAINEIKRQYQ